MAPSRVVSTNVRAVREMRDLSQARLAARCGWSRQTQAAIENGTRKTIAVEELLALALELDVAPVALLVPWGEDDVLEVDGRGLMTPAVIKSGDAFDWATGQASHNTRLGVNLVDYHRATPNPRQREWGRDLVAHLREAEGWTVDDEGRAVKGPFAQPARVAAADYDGLDEA